jgi:N utilization substance protein A
MSIVKLPGLKLLINEICQSHNLPQTTVEDALREALFKGYERYRRSKKNSMDSFSLDYFDNFRVELDLEEEGFRVVAIKIVTEEVTDEDHHIALEEVQEKFDAEIPLGSEVLLDVTPEQKDFGRMAAVQTKQVLQQKLKEEQRLMIQNEFKELEGTVLPAKVLRFERQSVIMTLQSAYGRPEVEAELPPYEQMNSDNYRANATFKVYLKKVREGTYRGPQLIVSRADAGLVVYLFANEVPEIEDEIIDIVAISREANPNVSPDGSSSKSATKITARTKMAVDTSDPDVDPVGACIGARGSRIQAVVNELKGEKIDVIRYSENPAEYIKNALSPAKIDEVILTDEEERESLVIVPDNQFSLAIGTKGQNVRLAARLTGWKIDIKKTSEYKNEEGE